MTGGGKFGFAGYAASQTSAAPPPVTPPGPITIYGDIAAPGVPDPGTIACCAMDSTQFTNFGVAIGVADIISGLGQYGLAYNDFGNTTYGIPPGPNATFVLAAANTPGSNRTTYEIDSLTYGQDWFGYGPPGSYEDVYNFGGIADNAGGAATSWSWTMTITAQSLSNGCVALVGGSSSTAQDSTFQTIGGTGIGQYVVVNAGRGGYPAGGDTMTIDVIVTATNSGGSASANWRCSINWL